MNLELAPVVVYTYSRLKHLQRTVSALQDNYLAKRSVLYVVSDGAKTADHKPFVDRVREYLDGVEGFREVVRIYRDRNLGTPRSIHEAEAQVISDHGRVISMEDDNLSSRNYLNFMNEGLNAYADDPSIFSICGYCPPIKVPEGFNSEYWFYNWNLSWGYAMWKKKYDRVYPLLNHYGEFRRQGLLGKVRKKGGWYITDALRVDYQKKAIFPDAVLCTKMTREGYCSVIPTVSKIQNIGSDGSGVSGSRLASKHDVKLDDRPLVDFGFSTLPPMNERLVLEAVKFYNGGVMSRLSRRLRMYHELSRLKQKLTSN
jgi:hypothetical protein